MGATWHNPAEPKLPRGAGTDRVSPFDAACLSNLPAASLHASSKLTPSIYAPSESAGKPREAGRKVGMVHKMLRFWDGLNPPCTKPGRGKHLHFCRSLLPVSILHCQLYPSVFHLQSKKEPFGNKPKYLCISPFKGRRGQHPV